jgi:hypothetical protein
MIEEPQINKRIIEKKFHYLIFIFWQCTPKQILIKVLTAMIIMHPYRNILLYGIESFICSLCLNNEIIIEIKLILFHLGYMMDRANKKNRLILTQSHIYCFQLFRSWLQIHMLIVMAFVFFNMDLYQKPSLIL